MKSKYFVTGLVCLAAVLMLAACASGATPTANTPQVENTPTPGEQPAPTTPPEKPAATATSAGVEKTIYVGPSQVDCTGVGPQKCLQVKEKPGDPYTLFYGQIAGFTFEEGNEYQLKVLETPVANPPADAPAFTWTLVEVVSKTPVATAAPTGQATAGLEGQEWQLDWYLDTAGKQTTVISTTEITALFDGGKLTGNDGCNSYFASYQVSGNTLKIDKIGATMMACPEPQMKQEQAYQTALGKAATYQITGDQLQIADAQGATILSYSAMKPVSLTNTLWEALAYNNGKGGLQSIASGSTVNATFSTDGKLSGSAGCNNYNASYTIDGDKLQIGPAISTKMACAEPQGVMEQEAAYLQALQKAATFKIEGDMLTIFDAQAARLAQYQANQLVGSKWNWVETKYSNDTTLTVDKPQNYNIQFLPDGTFSAKADCNNASGKYTASGNSVKIEMGPMTLAACPEGSLSDKYVEQLSHTALGMIVDGDLYFSMQMDVGIMQFTPMK